MHEVLEIVDPPVAVGEVCPCLQGFACASVVVEFCGAVLTLPYPALTPVDKYVSLWVVPVDVIQSPAAGLAFPSGTQQVSADYISGNVGGRSPTTGQADKPSSLQHMLRSNIRWISARNVPVRI